MDKRLESLKISLNYLNPKKDKIAFLKKMLKYETNMELTNDLVKLIRQSCDTLDCTCKRNNYLYLIKCVEYLKELVKSERDSNYLKNLYSLLNVFQIFFEKEIDTDYDSAILKKAIIKVNNEIKNVKFSIENRVETLTGKPIDIPKKENSQIVEKVKENNKYDEKYEIVKLLLFGQNDIHKLIETIRNFDTLTYSIKKHHKEIFKRLADEYLRSLLKNNNDSKYYYMVIVLLAKDYYGFNDSKEKFVKKLENGYEKIKKSDKKVDKKVVLEHELNEIIKICNKDTNDLNQKYNAVKIHKYDDLENIDNYKIAGTKNLYDFSNEKTFTIDSEDTKCLDDAISIKQLENGNYLIGVYIADTTCVINPNTAVDDYAFKVIESFGKKNLLPAVLSRNLCSLNKFGDKRVQAYLYEVTPNNIVINSKICSGFIKVKRRYSYEQVDDILMGYTKDDYSKELKRLYVFASYRMKHNIARQRYLETKEKKDPNRKNMQQYKHDSSSTIISELKVLVNSTTSEKIFKLGIPFIYRNNEKKDIIIPDDLKIIFNSNKKLADLKGYILDEYGESYYSEKNKGHYGIGVPAYAHLSTPLRNYLALYDQRIIRKAIIDGDLTDKEIVYFENDIPNVVEHANKVCTLNKIHKFEKQKAKTLTK